MAETKQLDPKYLEGLTYSGAEPRQVMVDGVEKTRNIPLIRPLQPDDVLSWTDKGDAVVIVTTDGRKYCVFKNTKPAGKAGKTAEK